MGFWAFYWEQLRRNGHYVVILYQRERGKAPALSRASVMKILIAEDEIVPEP